MGCDIIGKNIKHEVRKFKKIPLLKPYEVYPESYPENLICQNLNLVLIKIPTPSKEPLII